MYKLYFKMLFPQKLALGLITSRLSLLKTLAHAILRGLLLHSGHLVVTKELRRTCSDGAGGMDPRSQVVASRASLESLVRLGLRPDLWTLILLLFDFWTFTAWNTITDASICIFDSGCGTNYRNVLSRTSSRFVLLISPVTMGIIIPKAV